MKTALITGAAKGIGKATAIALAKDGFNIALHFNSSEDAANATAAELKTLGVDVKLFKADLTETGEAERLVKSVESDFGPLHTLVCNAGIIHDMPLALTPPDAWRKVFAANTEAPFLLTKTASRIMARRRAGRIIYVSSDAALMGDLFRGAYSASKAALLGLCRTAARELAASGITANAVAPGIIETDMTSDIPDTRRAKQIAMIPMARFGKPEEVASVIRFLASDDASWITGQTIVIDGGMNMR